MTYDPQNIFARILRGEIPNRTIHEDERVLAFEDIQPQAPVHILVIPKGQYVSLSDFSEKAGAAEIVAFHRAVAKIVQERNLAEDGYRVIANTNKNGGQDVPHFHLHILGGEKLPPMIKR